MSKATKELGRTTLKHYLGCSYPLVAIESNEEDRFIADTVSFTTSKGFEEIKVITISATNKLTDVTKSKKVFGGAVIEDQSSFAKAFTYAGTHKNHWLIVMDFQHIINNAAAYRALKDQIPNLKRNGSAVILVAPGWKLPAELSHDIPIIDFALPTRKELADALNVVTSSARIEELKDDARQLALDAASGLTLQEAENAFSLSVARGKAIIPDLVANEKMALIKAGGLLEIHQPPDFAPGGLDEVGKYIEKEVIEVFRDETMAVLLAPKGIIFVGVPGVGKSLLAAYIAKLLGWPLARMNFANLKGSLVGQSEGNIKAALKQVDAAAPVVLWIDEIEKGVGGHASSGQTDGGTTLGMLGTLLTWLQEHTSRVYVVATCNDYHKLPPELTRAGRFDERFFVDLPVTVEERTEIAMVHLKRFSKNADKKLAGVVADVSDGWTGAEIEQCVKSAARRTKMTVTAASLEDAAKEIRPISKVRGKEIDELRVWAQAAFRKANSVLDTSEEPARKIRA